MSESQNIEYKESWRDEYLKYLKAKITYKHDRRVETYPFAREAIREAVYNATAHDSITYNPDIANVFYRAGYIEAWGRGIQKICDECKVLGAELPRYEIIGNEIRVHFKALKSTLIEDFKELKRHISDALDDALVQRIIEELKSNPAISQKEIAERAGSTRRTIQRKMEELVKDNVIERVGGKRYGHWQIMK
jgi:hypothetical protein